MKKSELKALIKECLNEFNHDDVAQWDIDETEALNYMAGLKNKKEKINDPKSALYLEFIKTLKETPMSYIKSSGLPLNKAIDDLVTMALNFKR